MRLLATKSTTLCCFCRRIRWWHYYNGLLLLLVLLPCLVAVRGGEDGIISSSTTTTRSLSRPSFPRTTTILSSLVLSSSSSTLLSCRGGGRSSYDYHHNNEGSINNNRYYDFDKMSKLLQRLTALENVATDILLSYYDKELCTFASSGNVVRSGTSSTHTTTDTATTTIEYPIDHEQRGEHKRRICVTSTCYSLLSLKILLEDIASSSSSSSAGSNEGRNGGDTGGGVVSLDKTLHALLTTKWRDDDLFQIPLLLYTILFVDSDRTIIRNMVVGGEDIKGNDEKEGEESGNPNHEEILNLEREDEKLRIARRFQRLIRTVLDARPHRHYGIRQANSDYVIYQICKCIALLQRQQQQSLSSSSSSTSSNTATANAGIGGLPQCVIPSPSTIAYGDVNHDISLEIYFALLRCAEVASNELCRQLAYYSSHDSTSFDVIRLIYSLLTYVKSTEALSGIASIRELDMTTTTSTTTSSTSSSGDEQQPSPQFISETKVVPLNKKLVKKALGTFFEQQNPNNGLWEKGQPIYHHGSGKSSMGGSTSAFVFPVNTLGSLLCALPSEYFRPHLSCLERTLLWIETHQLTSIITEYCDLNTGQCYGKPIVGWNSPHYTAAGTSTGNGVSGVNGGGGGGSEQINDDVVNDNGDGPQAWSTAQVIKCIVWMKRTITELLHNDVLEEFHGVHYSKHGIQTSAWDRLLDSDLGDGSSTSSVMDQSTPQQDDVDGDSSNDNGNSGCRTIKSVLEERVVNPFATSIRNPSYGAAYSAILFGPPGTAKTTICEALAQRMGYDFVVIDTATFLADGLTNVAARIRYVFTRLMALNKCVILFDEIEEFVLDREIPNLSMESRMLTTAMLTAINDLRKKKQSIFFVATNRLQAFDKAITRPGRFDMQLFVGTPNLNSRVQQFEDALSSKMPVLDGDKKTEIIEAYRNFLKSVWTQDAMFMNYLEGMQFAKACVNVVGSGGNNNLTFTAMSEILKQQAAVMTVRKGTQSREDFIASMELSRL